LLDGGSLEKVTMARDIDVNLKIMKSTGSKPSTKRAWACSVKRKREDGDRILHQMLCQINGEATTSGQSSGSDSDANETDVRSAK